MKFITKMVVKQADCALIITKINSSLFNIYLCVLKSKSLTTLPKSAVHIASLTNKSLLYFLEISNNIAGTKVRVTCTMKADLSGLTWPLFMVWNAICIKLCKVTIIVQLLMNPRVPSLNLDTELQLWLGSYSAFWIPILDLISRKSPSSKLGWSTKVPAAGSAITGLLL